MEIDSIHLIPADSFNKNDLKYLYGTGKTKRIEILYHKRVVKEYRDGVMTPIGDIEFGVWREAILRVIESGRETEMFNALRVFYSKSEFLCMRKDAEFWAMVNYVSELYNISEWVGYDDFHKFYYNKNAPPE